MFVSYIWLERDDINKRFDKILLIVSVKDI